MDADWNTNREWTRMDANKRGERVFTGLYQPLGKTVRASIETALGAILGGSIRVYSRAFAVESLTLKSLV